MRYKVNRLAQGIILSPLVLIISTASVAVTDRSESTYSLTVEVNNLNNNEGVVQFALYNRDDAFPDEHYKKYHLILKGEVRNQTSKVTFKDLSAGTYAVNVLHDENEDGRIDKTLFLPKEGIGFSNYNKIGLGNRPDFKNASFLLNDDMHIVVKMIYL